MKIYKRKFNKRIILIKVKRIKQKNPKKKYNENEN